MERAVLAPFCSRGVGGVLSCSFSTAIRNENDLQKISQLFRGCRHDNTEHRRFLQDMCVSDELLCVGGHWHMLPMLQRYAVPGQSLPHPDED